MVQGRKVYTANVSFAFNDIIDPNPDYLRDTTFANMAHSFGYKCNDFKITITGNYQFNF